MPFQPVAQQVGVFQKLIGKKDIRPLQPDVEFVFVHSHKLAEGEVQGFENILPELIVRHTAWHPYPSFQTPKTKALYGFGF